MSRSSWLSIRVPLAPRRATMAKIAAFLIPLAVWATICFFWVPEVVVTEQNDGSYHHNDRVPRAKFDETLRRVQLTGDVIHRDVSAEDVTDQYVELETRLKNARAMRDRLEQLLARAAVKEAIDIEKELGRVTGDIEAMEGKLKVLKDKIAYSTLTVVFSPRGSNAVRDVPLRLPFGWLGDLGLPRLLSLGEGQ